LWSFLEISLIPDLTLDPVANFDAFLLNSLILSVRCLIFVSSTLMSYSSWTFSMASFLLGLECFVSKRMRLFFVGVFTGVLDDDLSLWSLLRLSTEELFLLLSSS